jgi:hypothetical protein
MQTIVGCGVAICIVMLITDATSCIAEPCQHKRVLAFFSDRCEQSKTDRARRMVWIPGGEFSMGAADPGASAGVVGMQHTRASAPAVTADQTELCRSHGCSVIAPDMEKETRKFPEGLVGSH